MCLARLALLTLLACLSLNLAAQPSIVKTKDNREVLKMGLYPPDILMRQQQRLAITDNQRKAIAVLVKTFQAEVTELQWAMPNEQQKLRQLLDAYPVEKEAALAQAAKVLKMETRFKQAHFELLIAIKNELTESQISMLDTAIRRRLPQEE